MSLTNSTTTDENQQLIDALVAEVDAGNVEPESMLHWLVRFVKWLRLGLCRIRSVNQTIIPLHPNPTQLLLLARLMVQAANGRPLRQRVLKARKHGVTTLYEALAYFLCSHRPEQVSNFIAHQGDSTVEIFEIAKTINREYKAPFGGGSDGLMKMVFADTHSRLICFTAGSESGAAGGTPNMLHLSEVALWPRTKKVVTEYASTQAVPFVPHSIIVYESTARGKELFFDRWSEAADPENPYDQIFIPWFLDDRCRVPTDPIEKDEDEVCLVGLADTYGIKLADESLAWRRVKLQEIGPQLFRQEYPSTPDEAVQAMANLVLPDMGSTLIDVLPFDAGNLPRDMLVGGIDHGFYDPTVIISAVLYDQVIYVIDTWRRSECLAEDCVQGLVSRHSYYCDPAATGARVELATAATRRKFDCSLQAAPRRRDHRFGDYSEAEWHAVAELRRHEKLKILDTPANRQMLLEADNFEYNPTTGQPKYFRSDAVGHFDSLDALRYLIMGVRSKTIDRVDDGRPVKVVSARRESMRSF